MSSARRERRDANRAGDRHARHPDPDRGGVAEIAINPLPGRQTSTSIDCSPQPVALLAPTTCTVTVTDVDAGTAFTPTGTINLTTLYGKIRNDRPPIASGFFGGPCTLSGSGASATCQTTYTPTLFEGGQHAISADYGGDGTHATSSASTPVTVVLRSTTTSLMCAQSMLTGGADDLHRIGHRHRPRPEQRRQRDRDVQRLQERPVHADGVQGRHLSDNVHPDVTRNRVAHDHCHVHAIPTRPLRRSERAQQRQHHGVGQRQLSVGPEEVVQFVEAGDGWLVAEGAVWSAVIVEVQPAGQCGVALLA